MQSIGFAAKSLFAALTFALAMFLTAAPAQAQATRTWVSGVGDDVNPCSRTAPCKTFAGAISKTAAGGEINCLDPAGYGAVTITKSITIDCQDTQGSILASSTNGVNINDSASGFPGSIRVVLRGLSINGAGGGAQNANGNPGTGLIGVSIISGASLLIEDCTIQNFNAGSALGVRVQPAGAFELTIHNSVIEENGLGNTGGGIRVQGLGAAGTAKITIHNVRLVNNGNVGFAVDTTGSLNSTGVFISMSNTIVSGVTSGSGAAVDVFQPVGGQGITMIVNDSTIANNTSIALRANGPGTRIQISGSTITNSGTAATTIGGAAINTFGNNLISGNASNGTFSGGPVPLL